MGRVIATQLAADGFDIAVAYAGGVDLADATVKEIAGTGGAAFAADVANEATGTRLPVKMRPTRHHTESSCGWPTAMLSWSGWPMDMDSRSGSSIDMDSRSGWPMAMVSWSGWPMDMDSS
jgi:hypothetical protein